MKLLHLTAYFFPEYSGTSTRLYNLLCRLPSEVLLLTSNRMMTGELIPQESEQFGNIEVRRLSLPAGKRPAGIPALRYLNIIYDYYLRQGKLIEPFGNEKWAIIQAHNVIPFGEAARKLARTLHVPFVTELHGMSEESLSGIARIIGGIYLQKETQRLLGQCDHAITLTHSLKEWLLKCYKLPEHRITVVPNGADTGQFSPNTEDKKKAEKLREKLGMPGKIVMYAGAMDHINGLDDLAGIIPQIIKERPTTSFVFIGNGPEQQKLLSLSEAYPRNVRCLRQVPYSEMSVYYQMCDVFIIPRPSTISAETLTPLKLLEVMAVEKPVLGSNVGGIAEVIRHGENGYLFRKGDLTSLKDTLLEVLDIDNIKVGKNARKTVARNYTWDNSARILQKIYEDLA